MRILHFVSSLSCGSGVMSVIMNYYRHIDRDKIQFDFLCFIQCKNSYEEEINALGGKIFYISPPSSSIKSIKELSAFFEKHAPDYAWLHNHEVYLSFILRPLSRRYGIPRFIIHCHTTKYSDRPASAVRNLFLCLPIRFMNCERFACSEAAGRFLYGKKMMKNGRVFILHNAIDCEKFKFKPEKREQLRKDMGFEGKYVIGHVGRFERQKNHQFLIRVFAEYHREHKNSVLILAGDGSLRLAMEKMVKLLGIEENVYFLGQRDDVAELYQMMDLFVLPSLFEGIGIVLLEAQSSGLLCLASNCIPHEANAGGVKFLSLKIPIRCWAKQIADTNVYRSKQLARFQASKYHVRELSTMGMDLSTAPTCLQEKYCKRM